MLLPSPLPTLASRGKRGRVDGPGGKAVELTNDACSSGAVSATSSMGSPEVAEDDNDDDDENDEDDDDDVDDDDDDDDVMTEKIPCIGFSKNVKCFNALVTKKAFS